MPRRLITASTTEERFWSKVLVGNEKECWPWQASTSGGGYGTFVIRHGQNTPAHRFAWSSENGPIPDGLWILHSCDNRPCCNPSHLFPGTRQDNVDDMMAKGRHWIRPLKGIANGRVKLTNAQVVEIRQRHAAGETQTAIVLDYPVSRIKIGHIVRGESWKHLLI